MHNHFTVRVGLEDGILVLEVLSELLVVVNLAVDSEHKVAVVADEGLSAGVNTNNGESLMDEDAVVRHNAA